MNPAGGWLARILGKGSSPLPRLVSAPASGAPSAAWWDPHLHSGAKARKRTCRGRLRGPELLPVPTREGAHVGATHSTEGPRDQDRPADATLHARTRATWRFAGTGHSGPARRGTKVLAAAGGLEVREGETKTTPAPGPRRPRLYLSPGHLALQQGHLLLQFVDAALRPLPVGPLRREVVLVGEDLRRADAHVWRWRPDPRSLEEEEARPPMPSGGGPAPREARRPRPRR